MASSDAVFQQMAKAMDQTGATLVKKVNGVIQFSIKNGATWTVDLKNGSGSVKKEAASGKVDLTITIAEEDLLALFNNKLNPQQAFMKGKLKIKGNMGLAMKLSSVITATRKMMEKEGNKDAAPAAGGAASSNLKSAAAFHLIGEALKSQGPELVKKVNGTIQFMITPGGTWHLDLKNGSGSLTTETKKADLTITVGDEDFFALANGKLNPQSAFMKGKIKVKGKMALAMKLNTVFAAARPKAKM